MAWDTDGTKRKIVEAATAEFVQHGPDGTTVERIAKLAGVNKERVYNYFGGKAALFALVLRDQLASASSEVRLAATSAEEVGEYAGRLFDYHRKHPELVRLLQWEALTFSEEVPQEQLRREYYGHKSSVLAAAQDEGTITSTMAPDVLHFMVVSLAAYWAVLPQVARMITGAAEDDDDEAARRRACVVDAATRLVAVQS
jgi:AcrR family transcriptional regulator